MRISYHLPRRWLHSSRNGSSPSRLAKYGSFGEAMVVMNHMIAPPNRHCRESTHCTNSAFRYSQKSSSARVSCAITGCAAPSQFSR